MNWSNLKFNKCPKCTCPLMGVGRLVKCQNSNCHFSISEEKMALIVNEKLNKSVGSEDEELRDYWE